MKHRRHHNNKGAQQIRSGTSARRLARLAKSLGIPFDSAPSVPSVVGFRFCEFCGKYNPTPDHVEICEDNLKQSNL